MTALAPTAAELGLGLDPALPEQRRVTLANWQIGPWNRWAFQHLSELIPTARIARGDGPPSELPVGRNLDAGALSIPAAGGPLRLDQWLDRTWTDALVVLRDGAIVLERYLNGMTPGTTHLLMSVSKSITGAAAGVLVQQGLLDVNALVTRYIPELATSAYADATVQQVLDMQVSVVFNEDYEDPASEVQTQDRCAGWRPRLPGDPAGDYELIQTLRKAGEHGRVFQYCSTDTDVLGWTMERVTGTPLPALLSRLLWAPLGAAHDAQITVDPSGHPFPNGGICVTARDLARFGQCLLQDGLFNGRQIIPAAWIDDIRFNGDNGPWAQPGSSAASAYPNGAYRNKFWITNDDHGSYYGTGIHGQQLWIDPVTRTVIAKLSTHPKPVDEAVYELQRVGLAAIARGV